MGCSGIDFGLNCARQARGFGDTPPFSRQPPLFEGGGYSKQYLPRLSRIDAGGEMLRELPGDGTGVPDPAGVGKGVGSKGGGSKGEDE